MLKVMFKNKRMRSKLNWEILKTFVSESTSSILASKLFHNLQNASKEGILRGMGTLENAGPFYRYLYRLAEAGFIKIEGLRRQKRLYITPKGRKAIKMLMEEEAKPKKEKIRTEFKIESNKEEDIRIARALKWIKSQLKKEQKNKRSSEISKIREVMSKACAKDCMSAFVSYDMPQEKAEERTKFSLLLRKLGFIKLNESFYLGETGKLKQVLEAAEDLEILPYVFWGRLQMMSP